MCINMSSFGSLCLVVVKISLVPFFCGKMRQNLLMERKYASTVGMCINLLELASTCWNLHQRVGICINLLELASMCWNWDWKYHQQLESASTCWNYDRNVHPQLELASIVGIMIDKCINNWKVHQLLESGWKLPQQLVCGVNLLEWQLKMHQQLECASIVGMWHQHLEGASNVGFGLETDLRGIKSHFWHHVDIGFCEELMRTHLTRSTHLFALSSMCYLPEWNIVNNNNKYTQNINGDINGMLTSPFSRFSSLSCW